MRAVAPIAVQIEVAVSDGSDGDASGAVDHRLLTGWPGGAPIRVEPALPLVENMNRAVEISTGQWVMQLDGDDRAGGSSGSAASSTWSRNRRCGGCCAAPPSCGSPPTVARRAAMEQEGLFDTSVGATDTDMWLRLFSRYGARCLPRATCAHTIQEAAAATSVALPGQLVPV